MPREVYERVCASVLEHNPYFSQKKDALGFVGISTDTKLAIALKQLSYGEPGDRVESEFWVSEATATNFLKLFCESVVDCFQAKYTRLPNQAEMKNSSDMHAKLGFRGCLRGLDCASWKWDNWPVAIQGTHKGLGKKPCIRMETISDDNTFIWHSILDLLVQRMTSISGIHCLCSETFKLRSGHCWS